MRQASIVLSLSIPGLIAVASCSADQGAVTQTGAGGAATTATSSQTGGGQGGATSVTSSSDATTTTGMGGMGGGGGGTGGTLCAAGTITCAGTVKQVCDGNGGFSETVDCALTNEVCVDKIGCVLCAPNTGTCNGQVGTFCLPDGSGYGTETCDPLQATTCNPLSGRCDGTCGPQQIGTSYIGCDYYPTVTANLVGTQFHFAVAVANTTASDATVTATQGANVLSTITVPADSVQIINLPWQLTLKGPASNSIVPMNGSVQVADGAYRVRSTQPVTVYQFSPIEYTNGGNCLFDQTACSFSNDASLLLPTNVWTGTYRVASRHHWYTSSGFYAVTAKEDNTTVTVTPGPNGGTVKAGINGIATSGNGVVTLNEGDVIEVVTNGANSASATDDVTGTLVSADKPVQVIGGHQCINVPDLVGYCDHLEESMFPYETLANDYIVTAPLIPTGGNIPKVNMVRVIATQPGTTLAYDPPQAGAPTSIGLAGAWIEIANTIQDFKISADQPILVVQYMEGQDAGGNIGDPAMTIAVSESQFRTSYLFHAPTNYDDSYANIVAPTGVDVLLDGASVVGFTPIGATGFSIARVALSNAGSGNHTATAIKGFGISVYGYGQYTSYWYPGGSDLEQLHQ